MELCFLTSHNRNSQFYEKPALANYLLCCVVLCFLCCVLLCCVVLCCVVLCCVVLCCVVFVVLCCVVLAYAIRESSLSINTVSFHTIPFRIVSEWTDTYTYLCMQQCVPRTFTLQNMPVHTVTHIYTCTLTGHTNRHLY